MNIKTAVMIGGIVLGAGIGSPVQGSQRMQVQVYPRVASAPANILISVGFARNADNRVLRVIAESDDFFRSSEVQINGDSGPRVSSFTFRSLPPGWYSLEAELIGSNGRTREVERVTFVVS